MSGEHATRAGAPEDSVESVAKRMLSTQVLDEVLAELVAGACSLTGACLAVFGELDGQGTHFTRSASVGLNRSTWDQFDVALGEEPLLDVMLREYVALRVADVREEQGISPALRQHPRVRSLIAVPVLHDGECLGHLHVAGDVPNSLSTAHTEAMERLCQWAAIAIANARERMREQYRLTVLAEASRRYDAMIEIAQAVGGVPELARVLEVVAARARSLVDARAAVISLLEAEDFVVCAAAGDHSDALQDLRMPVEGSVSGYALARDVAVHLRDVPPGLGSSIIARLHPEDGLFVPLNFRGQPLGMLTVFDRLSDGPQFNDDDALVIEGIAASAATAVATAQGFAAHALSRSMAAAEEERRKWARELHDQTLQDLAGVKLLLDTAAEAAKPDDARQLVSLAALRTGEAITELRHLLNELRPPVLDAAGVAPALYELVERFHQHFGIETSVHVELSYEQGRAATRLKRAVEETIYRLVQEALNNVIKHADARHVTISVMEQDDAVEITVSDDGVGYDQRRPTRGFGLIAMRERLELVGGRLRIDASTGQGTRLIASIPAARAARASSPVSPATG